MNKLITSLLLFTSLILASLHVAAQTNPLPFALSGGNWSFTGWNSTTAAGSYPGNGANGTAGVGVVVGAASANAVWHRCGVVNPSIGDPTSTNYTGTYVTGGAVPPSRIEGLSGTNGFAFYNNNSASLDHNLGAFVIGLNSTGRTNISISFYVQCIGAGAASGVRLQYRQSTASPWQDVPGPVDFSVGQLTGAGTFNTLTANLSILTSNIVDNRPNMQVRLKYHYISGSGSCAKFRVDDINISSTALSGDFINTGTVSGSPFCVSPLLGTNVAVPFTYSPIGNFPVGTTFTAELSNSVGIFTTPTTIGSIASNGSGAQSIAAILPANISSGTGYRIRVICSSPVVNGLDNNADLAINLSPSNVSLPNANPGSGQAGITWTLPPPCYNEIMVVAYPLVPVAGTPSGNGSAYTPNAVYGSGTPFGSGFIVYKGGGSSVTVTGLSNGTLYYFKIWTRYGTEWSGGQEVSCTPAGGTILKRGDFVVIGINANNGCAAAATSDEISFICFRDITTSTTIDVTDNGYERFVANKWGNTEGVVRMTRTGGLIPAGTVITIRFDGTTATGGSGITPDAGWSFADISGGFGVFNLNAGGDQFFFMQGGTWSPGTSASHNAVYSGTVLFACNTSNNPWTSFANTTQQSGLYPFLDCYTIKPALAATDFFKYTGSLATSRTQRAWVDELNDNTKWTAYTAGTATVNCNSYESATPQYQIPTLTITILPGGYQRGKWQGSKDTDWFTCDNWEDFVIPDSLTDVLIPSTGVTNNCFLKKDSVHYCKNLDIQGYKLNGSFSTGMLSKTLRVYGSLTLTDPGVLDFSDADATTVDGTIYVKGNWTNYDETAFKQGNSKVYFNGPSIQTITTPVKEVFYNLEIANTGGITASTSINVENNLTLTSGVISSGTNEIYVTNNAVGSIAGYSTASYVNGNLRRQITTTGSYDFPVGSLTNYELANLNIVSQTGISNIVTTFVSPSTGTTPAPGTCIVNTSPIYGMLDAGSWTILPNNTPISINADLTLNERGHTNSAAGPTYYGIIRRDNETSTWLGSPLGTHSNATQSETGGTATAKRTAISTTGFFGDFAIGFGNGSLPVEWLMFNGTPVERQTKLFWSTATEKSNDYFNVQRSNDGIHFEKIGRVQGSGTSTTISKYTFYDQAPYKGINYYRLQQVDYDGNSDYSNIIAVNFRDENPVKQFQLYPNPATDQIWLLLNNENENISEARIELFNALGQQCKLMEISLNASDSLYSLDINDLDKGVYIARINNQAFRFIKK